MVVGREQRVESFGLIPDQVLRSLEQQIATALDELAAGFVALLRLVHAHPADHLAAELGDRMEQIVGESRVRTASCTASR
jgi:hypothetical protein